MAKLSVGRWQILCRFCYPFFNPLIVAGGPTTKLMFHPMILGTVNILIMVNTVIFPDIFFILVSLLSTFLKGELGKLAELGRKIITFIITATLQYLLEY